MLTTNKQRLIIMSLFQLYKGNNTNANIVLPPQTYQTLIWPEPDQRNIQNVEVRALGRSRPKEWLFYPGTLLLHWWSVWDHCHTGKWSRCQSDSSRWYWMMDQNVMVRFCFIFPWIWIRIVRNITGWDVSPNQTEPRPCFTDGCRHCRTWPDLNQEKNLD